MKSAKMMRYYKVQAFSKDDSTFLDVKERLIGPVFHNPQSYNSGREGSKFSIASFEAWGMENAFNIIRDACKGLDGVYDIHLTEIKSLENEIPVF